jgi:hypothetical protein
MYQIDLHAFSFLLLCMAQHQSVFRGLHADVSLATAAGVWRTFWNRQAPDLGNGKAMPAQQCNTCLLI